MIVALALIAGSLTVAWLMDHLLRRADLSRRDPALLIVSRLTTMAAVLAGITSGLLLLILPSHGPFLSLVSAAHECWIAVQHGAPLEAENIIGASGLVFVFAATIRVVVVTARRARARVHERSRQLGTLRMVSRSSPGSPSTLWLPHDRPLAFCLPGRKGVVVATDGLTRHLPEAAVSAVLEHEHAHLRGRHHLVVATADLLRYALPFLALFRHAPAAIRQLVEISADVAAVRRHGSAAVHTALLAVSRHGAPPTALAMGEEAIDLRLTRLRHDCPPPRRVYRTVSCGLATLSAAVLPFATGTALLFGAMIVLCIAR
ncbi:M56 family metallopeptidase [Amycolatopsis sp. YIM 10]|uniref:M56 family metallopeptidase n=1 Tax=Amycolatopsis sp. YIM 10 TaxID=2653857 RepID=UPI00128FCD2B|nr:M56 family metallopeptidase [Amycolatopsis sp. YIM 10]QFU89763.1 Peptidase family M48 [Amycolatopsis sp. YIM 10]